MQRAFLGFSSPTADTLSFAKDSIVMAGTLAEEIEERIGDAF
jgi:hypothetical protein